MFSNFSLYSRDRVWFVRDGEEVVAEIHLDYLDQVDEVVLYASSSAEIQLQVLRLTASHVQQYVKSRRVSGGILVAEYSNRDLTRIDSDRLMSFDAIPLEILMMEREEIIMGLRPVHIDIVTAIHENLDEAMSDVVLQVGIDSLQFEVSQQRQSIFENEVVLQFSVKKPYHFSFWNASTPSPGLGDFDLNIVPPYHPATNNCESVGMVNGATDAYIRGSAVRSIYCPRAAQADRHGRNFGTSWNHVKHPFYAIGRKVELKVIITKLRSAEGVAELVQLLRAALGLDRAYVSISGGFRPPLKCAHNRLVQTGQRSPYPRADYSGHGHIARGSEAHCVWTYRVLEAEGNLKGAYIPPWFRSEGWLAIYEGAEVRHGLY